MDIELERMDGLTATKRIMKRDACANIVILTTFNTSLFRKASLLAGAKEFIGKDNLSSIQSLISRSSKK